MKYLIAILLKQPNTNELPTEISLKYNKSIRKLAYIEKINLLKYMTNNNILKYQGSLNCLLNDPDKQFCIYHLLSPKMISKRKRVLIGEKRDGCYVLLDDFDKIKIAYSFGISKMIQFDYELAKMGIDVYMYDHTISSLPYNHEKFHWEKIGICGKNTKNKNLKTLEELMQKNNHIHEKNMILKIDVEHWEWESLQDLPESILKQFKYIIIEYHFTKPNEGILYYNVIKKIHNYHQPFYFRCHNKSRIINFGNNRICRALEVSYIIRENNRFIKDNAIYPIYNLDYSKPIINGENEFEVNILTLFD